jgi:hypothetical protein
MICNNKPRSNDKRFQIVLVDFQVQTVVVPLPTSSSSDKYDANDDDVVSIERQQETAFVVVASSRCRSYKTFKVPKLRVFVPGSPFQLKLMVMSEVKSLP